MARFLSHVKVNPRIEIDREQFPFNLPVFREFNHLEFHPQVTFFVGENGSGKSTLLEAIATNYGFAAEGGSKHHRHSSFDSHSDMGDKLVIAKEDFPKDTLFFRSESFYNLATYLDEAARDAGKAPRYGWVHQRSHGEGFLDTIASLQPHGLYLLDEPESALSVQGQITFLAQMKRLVESDSQFVIATHSPIILGFGNSWIYRFGEDRIEKTVYQETDSFRLTVEFLSNRNRIAGLIGLDSLDD